MKLIWTYEACKEVALKFKTKKEFSKTYGGAYASAKKNKWLNDICGHMIPLGNMFYRCIYAYEFTDNSAYIGLTYNIEERNAAHIKSGRKSDSAVRNYMLKTGLTPKLVQLTCYIPYHKAVKEETNWANKYKTNGWILLNRKQTGIVGLRNSKYTKKECKDILLKYKFKGDLQRDHPTLLNYCRNHKWYQSLIKKLKLKKKKHNYWTKEKCFEVSKSFSNIGDFRDKFPSAYATMCQNGWRKDLIGILAGARNPHGYWSKDNCNKAADKTKSRTEFRLMNVTAYEISRTNKWLDEFFPKK